MEDSIRDWSVAFIDANEIMGDTIPEIDTAFVREEHQ